MVGGWRGGWDEWDEWDLWVDNGDEVCLAVEEIMKRLPAILMLLICLLLPSSAPAQTILGKNPYDKIVDSFFVPATNGTSVETNADTIIKGLNTYGTIPLNGSGSGTSYSFSTNFSVTGGTNVDVVSTPYAVTASVATNALNLIDGGGGTNSYSTVAYTNIDYSTLYFYGSYLASENGKYHTNALLGCFTNTTGFVIGFISDEGAYAVGPAPFSSLSGGNSDYLAPSTNTADLECTPGFWLQLQAPSGSPASYFGNTSQATWTQYYKGDASGLNNYSTKNLLQFGNSVQGNISQIYARPCWMFMTFGSNPTNGYILTGTTPTNMQPSLYPAIQNPGDGNISGFRNGGLILYGGQFIAFYTAQQLSSNKNAIAVSPDGFTFTHLGMCKLGTNLVSDSTCQYSPNWFVDSTNGLNFVMDVNSGASVWLAAVNTNNLATVITNNAWRLTQTNGTDLVGSDPFMLYNNGTYYVFTSDWEYSSKLETTNYSPLFHSGGSILFEGTCVFKYGTDWWWLKSNMTPPYEYKTSTDLTNWSASKYINLPVANSVDRQSSAAGSMIYIPGDSTYQSSLIGPFCFSFPGFTGNGSGLTNLQASGVSTNGSTAGQVMINGGNGTVLWTNNQSVVAAGAGETAETMTTNPVTGQVTYTSNVDTNQFLASTGNSPFNGSAITNLNLQITASVSVPLTNGLSLTNFTIADGLTNPPGYLRAVLVCITNDSCGLKTNSETPIDEFCVIIAGSSRGQLFSVSADSTGTNIIFNYTGSIYAAFVYGGTANVAVQSFSNFKFKAYYHQ